MKFQIPNSKFQKYCQGQVVITLIFFFIFISLIIVFGSSFIVLKETKIVRNFALSQKSYFLAEAGAEDISYRILTARHYDSSENLDIDGFSVTTTVSGEEEDKEIVSTADVSNLIRKVKVFLSTSDEASFCYGVQIGDGGFVMENTSTVSGNVYSNGAVQGSGSNLIKGDVVSAGPSGSIDGIHATSSAYGHSISDSMIDKDAYYYDNNIFNTIVDGISYPDSPDQPPSELPIPEELINEWEQAAAATVISSPCPYIIKKTTATLGPAKIACDLEIEKSTVTLAGPVWVTGDITIKVSGTIIKIDPLLGDKSVIMIADKPSDRLTSSKVSLDNTVIFEGSGFPGSYVLIVSQNNSAETGGSEKAITASESISGKLLLYAGHGEILLQNTVNLKEVTGYKIRLQNTAEVVYESGLASLLFSSGPSGSYSVIGWEEVY